MGQFLRVVARQPEPQLGIQPRRLGQTAQPAAGRFGPDRALLGGGVVLVEQAHHAHVQPGQLVFAALAQTPRHVGQHDRKLQIAFVHQTDAEGGQAACHLEALAVLQSGQLVEGIAGLPDQTVEPFGLAEAAVACETGKGIEELLATTGDEGRSTIPARTHLRIKSL